MLASFETRVIAVAACLVFGFPVAYFLAMKVREAAVPDRALHPRARAVLDELPHALGRLGLPADGPRGSAQPVPDQARTSSASRCSTRGSRTLSVRLAMIQLYILFMVTPIFFLLAQVDRHAIEAARDLGGNWWSTFREVILPQTMPGIVIGSIFIFVLTMGEYGTVQVISQGAVTTVGDVHPAADRRHPVPAGRGVGGAARADPDHGRVRDHPLLEPARGASE